MRTASVVLFLAAGFYVSFILVKNSGERIRLASRSFALASLIEEQILYSRTPVNEILSMFDGGKEQIKYLEESDEYASKLILGICTSDFDAAHADAVLLKNYTEKEMKRITEEETRLRRAKIFIPPIVSLLAVILLL